MLYLLGSMSAFSLRFSSEKLPQGPPQITNGYTLGAYSVGHEARMPSHDTQGRPYGVEPEQRKIMMLYGLTLR